MVFSQGGHTKHSIIQTEDEWCSRKGVILNTTLYKQEKNGVLASGVILNTTENGTPEWFQG